MNKRLVVLMLQIASLTTACTAGGVYEEIRNARRAECNRLLEPDRSVCLEQYKDDYETYDRKRKGEY